MEPDPVAIFGKALQRVSTRLMGEFGEGAGEYHRPDLVDQIVAADGFEALHAGIAVHLDDDEIGEIARRRHVEDIDAGHAQADGFRSLQRDIGEARGTSVVKSATSLPA